MGPYKYRSRGQAKDGTEIFELVPLNDNYPIITVDSTNPGRIVGPVVEVRKKYRRRS